MNRLIAKVFDLAANLEMFMKGGKVSCYVIQKGQVRTQARPSTTLQRIDHVAQAQVVFTFPVQKTEEFIRCVLDPILSGLACRNHLSEFVKNPHLQFALKDRPVFLYGSLVWHPAPEWILI